MIICTSVSHGNTKRIADTIGAELQAPVFAPEQVDLDALAATQLVGFGSGVFNMNLHPRLREFVQSLPTRQSGTAFVFTTSGLPEPPFRQYTARFARTLELKGFHVAGTFSCRALDTWLPFKLVGGINKSRPDHADLAAARHFAGTLLRQTR